MSLSKTITCQRSLVWFWVVCFVTWHWFFVVHSNRPEKTSGANRPCDGPVRCSASPGNDRNVTHAQPKKSSRVQQIKDSICHRRQHQQHTGLVTSSNQRRLWTFELHTCAAIIRGSHSRGRPVPPTRMRISIDYIQINCLTNKNFAFLQACRVFLQT